MPSEPIIFGNIQESGDAELAGASPLAINALVDGKGAVKRRPGIKVWADMPLAVPFVGTVVGITDLGGNLYYMTQEALSRRAMCIISGGVASALTNPADSTTYLYGTERPMFAISPYRIAVSGGDYPLEYRIGDTYAVPLGTYGLLSPPDSTQIIAYGGRLMSDDLTSSQTGDFIRFSGLGLTGQEDWDPLEYVSSDARPDGIVALGENANEVYVFGETSMQVFVADPNSVLAPARTINRGCAAAASVVKQDDAFLWLDNLRRFIRSDGRTEEDISQPIHSTLDTLASVSDCWAFRCHIDQGDYVGWVFPSDGRTFVWDADTGGWAQWQGWSNGGHTLWRAKSYHNWTQQNVHLVGLDNGVIGELDMATNTDLGDTFKVEVRTGFLDHKTQARKSCNSIRLRFKRGQNASGGTLFLSWRDDLGAFSSPLKIDLGTSGEYNPVVQFRSLGVYRQRQWKLDMTDSVNLLLAGVQEDFTVLDD